MQEKSEKPIFRKHNSINWDIGHYQQWSRKKKKRSAEIKSQMSQHIIFMMIDKKKKMKWQVAYLGKQD